MQDDPDRLIRELLDPQRVPSENEIKRILDHVAKAPFSSRPVLVHRGIRGHLFQWYNDHRLSGNGDREDQSDSGCTLAMRTAYTSEDFDRDIRRLISDPAA
ncbi:MAG: hypothetical protein EPO21_00645 [Chloroflexota bacterium]|nr:MAG: hypothetical protein EPO21_00645 [Chloroflexota bacterium]